MDSIREPINCLTQRTFACFCNWHLKNENFGIRQENLVSRFCFPSAKLGWNIN